MNYEMFHVEHFTMEIPVEGCYTDIVQGMYPFGLED